MPTIGRKARLALLLFGLLSLFVLLAITRGSNRNDEVAARIAALGGRVERKPRPQLPEIVYDLLRLTGWQGDYQAIVSIHLHGCAGLSDADLEQIGALDEVVELNLDRTNVSDLGLRHLRSMTSLERLRLNRTPILGAGIRDFAGLERLKLLQLRSTRLTDANLKYIGECDSLEYLDLSNTKISGDGLHHLCGLSRLKHLEMYHTHVTLADFLRVADIGRKDVILGKRAMTSVYLSDADTEEKAQEAARRRFPHVDFTFPLPAEPVSRSGVLGGGGEF